MAVIALEKKRNARDFGGLPTTDGRKIREGLFLRTGRLNDLTEAEEQLLTETYQLRRIVDLRMEIESEELPDTIVSGAELIPMRIITEAAIGITRDRKTEDEVKRLAGTPYMPEFYAMLVEEERCVRMLGETLRLIMEPSDGATLWHCSEGKDRCGMVSALFLYTLGVDEEKILQDYLLTNEVSEPRAAKLRDHVLALGADEETAQKIYLSYQAKEEYLRAAIDSIHANWGSMDDFIRDALGISDEEKEAFRNRVLE